MILVVALLLAQQPAAIGERSMVSKCAVADDATYGYSRSNPIKVGGTPMGGPARQRQYLRALVGPAGQPLTFKRLGSMAPDAENIILDLYELTIAGVEKPIELYLDLYRWDPPRAPQGFLCGAEIGLAPPGAEPRPGVAGPPAGAPRPPMPRPLPWDRMVQAAIDSGQKEDHPPVPLKPSEPLRYGVVFDPFTRLARLARAAVLAGKSVSPDMLSAVRPVETLIIAFPLDCGGRSVKPKTIEMVSTAMPGRPLGKVGGILEGEALARALPAFTAPEGSIGVMLTASMVPVGDVTIGYDGAACPSESTAVTLNVRMAISGRTQPAPPVWPLGVDAVPGSTVQVTVHALIDAEGVAQDIRVVEGPEAFHAAAVEMVKRMNHGVMTINGVVSRTPRPSAQTMYFRR